MLVHDFYGFSMIFNDSTVWDHIVWDPTGILQLGILQSGILQSRPTNFGPPYSFVMNMKMKSTNNEQFGSYSLGSYSLALRILGSYSLEPRTLELAMHLLVLEDDI